MNDNISFNNKNEIMKQIDDKDTVTSEHLNRVSYYSMLIGKKLNLSEEELKTLEDGGMFHDIGKVGIPNDILKKPGNLTDEEYRIMKTHTLIGADMAKSNKGLSNVLPIIKHHHERYDGTGYPSSLAGEDIPLLARIVSVADSFDAMTSERPYKSKYPLSKAIDELRNRKRDTI